MSQGDRRFLILHGVENHRPPEHWQHWLAEELRRRHEVVLYPQLPDPDSPSLESWLELVRAELAQLGDGERIVLCHSLASLAWLHLPGRLNANERVHRVLLVSPPSPEILWAKIAHFAAPADLSPGSIRSASDTTRIVCSDNDPYCPPGADRLFAEPLQLPADRIPGGGHLSDGDGYGPWPSILAWCLDETVPLRG
jgi:predicted alpha/beta hydrolase family esterase